MSANVQRIIETAKLQTVYDAGKKQTIDVGMTIISTKKRYSKRQYNRFLENAKIVDFDNLSIVNILMKIEKVSFLIGCAGIILFLPAVLVMLSIDMMLYHHITTPMMMFIIASSGTYIMNQVILGLIFLIFRK